MDGVSNDFGIGIALESLEVIRIVHSLKLGYQDLNNKAEYEALVTGFWVAMKVGAIEVKVCLDSCLVVS